MILTVHCSHDFNKMDAGAIEIFAANTVTDMGTFPLIFVTPKIPLATITTQVAAVHTANLNFGLNPLTKPLLDAAMKTLRTSLRQQADYVDGIANGDATIIEKSGFHATQSESNPAVIPAARQNFDAEAIPHTAGGVHVSADPNPGAKGHVTIVRTPDVAITITGSQITFKVGNSVASVLIDTHRTGDFLNLPSLTPMKSRSASFNTAGMGDFTADMDVSAT